MIFSSLYSEAMALTNNSHSGCVYFYKVPIEFVNYIKKSTDKEKPDKENSKQDYIEKSLPKLTLF